MPDLPQFTDSSATIDLRLRDGKKENGHRPGKRKIAPAPTWLRHRTLSRHRAFRINAREAVHPVNPRQSTSIYAVRAIKMESGSNETSLEGKGPLMREKPDRRSQSRISSSV